MPLNPNYDKWHHATLLNHLFDYATSRLAQRTCALWATIFYKELAPADSDDYLGPCHCNNCLYTFEQRLQASPFLRT